MSDTFSFGDHDGAPINLTHGDGAECLNALSSASVDLVVTSPPYFIGKEYDVSRSIADFRAEIRRIMPAIEHCLREGGNLCWQVGNHLDEGILTPLDAIVIEEMRAFTKFALKNRIIWTFGHGAHATTRFSGRHEVILWYQHGRSGYFDLDSVRVPQRYPGKRHYKGPKKGEWSGNPLGKNPGDVWDLADVWDIPNVKSNHVEKTDHPCQFPTALVRRLITALSSDGGLVVDPYVGSGTSALAAALEGRAFAGADTNSEYIGLAAERIEAFLDGVVRVREDMPVTAPDLNSSVTQRPRHFK